MLLKIKYPKKNGGMLFFSVINVLIKRCFEL
jgi:hypothetical protein